MEHATQMKSRFGMVIDLDRCNGCGTCMIACAVENNVAPAEPKANERTGVTWLRVGTMVNDAPFPETDTVFVPMMCQQCEHETPCISVCPQNAVDLDPETGIVGQVPQRCLGCRYCMTACPYHARYFNWWDPSWPAGMERSMNPDVAPRMRGIVEKCNFCHGRLHAARTKAAAEGRTAIDPADYVPACVASCPTKAITFGDLEDTNSAVAQLSQHPHTFRFLARLGTGSKVYYHSSKEWVRNRAASLQSV